jgi:hypothetical protein
MNSPDFDFPMAVPDSLRVGYNVHTAMASPLRIFSGDETLDEEEAICEYHHGGGRKCSAPDEDEDCL